jgi:hypothetical protein
MRTYPSFESGRSKVAFAVCGSLLLAGCSSAPENTSSTKASHTDISCNAPEQAYDGLGVDVYPKLKDLLGTLGAVSFKNGWNYYQGYVEQRFKDQGMPEGTHIKVSARVGTMQYQSDIAEAHLLIADAAEDGGQLRDSTSYVFVPGEIGTVVKDAVMPSANLRFEPVVPQQSDTACKA